MNGIASRCLRLPALATAVLVGGWTPLPAVAQSCAAVPQPEARDSAFAVGGLFASGAVDLTPSGRVRLAAFARALEAADIEVIVVRVPLAVDTPAAEARHMLALKRASALRAQLALFGIAEKHIYTEAAGPPIDTEPVVIETVGQWSPVQVALRRTCGVPV